MKNIEKAEREDAQHVNREGDEEEEEETVIPSTDAVRHPGTVMVECLFVNEKCSKNNKSVSVNNQILVASNIRILPQYSDCTPNNGSIAAVDRIYMSRTTSCER